MSLLVSVKEAEFTYLKNECNATVGNLSVQLQKLKDAGYIEIEKKFKGNYPLTMCHITEKGSQAFAQYVAALQHYIKR
jgi:DNA-binding PadR family transcriptional regulator